MTGRRTGRWQQRRSMKMTSEEQQWRRRRSGASGSAGCGALRTSTACASCQIRTPSIDFCSIDSRWMAGCARKFTKPIVDSYYTVIIPLLAVNKQNVAYKSSSNYLSVWRWHIVHAWHLGSCKCQISEPCLFCSVPSHAVCIRCLFYCFYRANKVNDWLAIAHLRVI